MPLSIRLPNEIEERLDNLAASTGRSKTYYVTQAILNYIEDLEDFYLTESRMDAIRIGKSEIVPIENILREHGLDNWIR